MRKVLIVTYYWPPSGGGGVQRWLKFVKYLREFKYEPIVYTPETQNAPSVDTSLIKDIPEGITLLKKPIWEPYDLYRFLTGRKKNESLGAAFASEKKEGLKEIVSNWIRSNLFIPDARRFWIRPSVKFLTRYLKHHPTDLIVTTGPPHSMHLIGYHLKKKLGVKWIADFRDPWTDIDYYDELRLTRWADRRHHKLENQVLSSADQVLCVSNSNMQKLKTKGAANIRVITNGYDEEDIVSKHYPVDSKFGIVHIGTFMNNRNPEMLWAALRELTEENASFKDDLEIKLVGKTDAAILDSIRKSGLQNHMIVENPVSHEHALILQKKAPVLLLCVNKSGDTKGMVTGKIFEYIASGRPILAIGPEDGDLAGILKDTNAGVISDFNNQGSIKRHILTYYHQYKAENLAGKAKNTEKYTRKALTRQLSNIFDEILQNK